MDFKHENTYGVAGAAEERRGPDRPLASHHQVKRVEQVMWDLMHISQQLPQGSAMLGSLGGHNLLTQDALRAARIAALRQIFDAFGFGVPEIM